MLKSIGGMEKRIKVLSECFTTKLTLDGSMFRCEGTGKDSDLRVIMDK